VKMDIYFSEMKVSSVKQKEEYTIVSFFNKLCEDLDLTLNPGSLIFFLNPFQDHVCETRS
jgi:hypothetical protein